MIFNSYSSYTFLDKSVINIIVITSVCWAIKQIVHLIKYLHHYSKFPKDTNCSFIFGDLITFFPNYWNTDVKTFQKSSTKLFLRNASDHQEKSGLSMIWIGWVPVIYLSDYKSIETLITKSIVSKPFFYKFVGLKEGLVTSKVDKWKMRRKMIEPFFVSKQQKIFILTIDQVFDSLINKELVQVSDKKPLTLSDHIHKTTCDIIFKLTMNTPIESEKEAKRHIIETIKLMEEETMKRLANPLLWIDRIHSATACGGKFNEMMTRAFKFFDSSIRQNIDHDANEIAKDIHTKSSTHIDFVNMLMRSNKGEIDLQGISEELLTFIVAGHETTATALNWILFSLGNRLDIQENVYQEITSIFTDQESINDIDKVSQCTYLEKCIKETMRLYTPIPLISRVIEEDIDINGFRCLKGSTAICNIVSIHRDPRVYPNPDQFDPERFDVANLTNIPKGAYIPFGFTPRNCIGYRFALLEMKIFLIHILRRFEITPVQKPEDVTFITELALKPSCQLKFILHKR